MVFFNFFKGFSFWKNAPRENSWCHVFCVLITQNTEHRDQNTEHMTTSIFSRSFQKMFLTFCKGIVGEIKKLKRTRQTETNLMVLLNFFNGFSFLKKSLVENSRCHVFCVLRTQNTEHRTRRPEHRTPTTKIVSANLEASCDVRSFKKNHNFLFENRWKK